MNSNLGILILSTHLSTGTLREAWENDKCLVENFDIL